jgi:hypothetical protein
MVGHPPFRDRARGKGVHPAPSKAPTLVIPEDGVLVRLESGLPAGGNGGWELRRRRGYVSLPSTIARGAHLGAIRGSGLLHTIAMHYHLP